MAIVFQCECGNEFQTREEDAGRRARCPACQRELIVPQPKPFSAGDHTMLHGLGPTRTSGKAIASLVLGLCSIVTCLLTGLPAIVLGILGLLDIKNPTKRLTGQGFAIAGIVLGSVTSLLISVLVLPALLIGLLLPALQSAREAARRATCSNNLKQIVLALHEYADANGCFPPAATYASDGKPLLSWRVLILPYLNERALYDRFHLDEPWNSPQNKPLGDRAPAVFQCPSAAIPTGLTTYEIVVDPHSMFTGQPTGVTVQSVTDGTATTLAVVESAAPVSWSRPEGLSLASDDAMLGMGSNHPGGFNVSLADGSVQFIKNSIIPAVLKGLVTRDGGEAVAVPR